MTLLVESFRGNYVEDKHYGSFAVVDSHGKVIDKQGNVEHPIFARSSVKPLQALALIESGAAKHWDLTNREIALACASHYGEDIHVEIAEKWAKKIRVKDANLCCGIYKSLHWEVASALIRERRPNTVFHHPCSGKHLGFLSTALHYNEPIDGYILRKHPVQKAVEQTLNEMTSFETLLTPFGTDGCSAPALTFPLYNLALAFARFGSDSQSVPFNRREAANQILDALREHPLLISGTKGFDSKIIEVTQGRVFTKIGAASVYTATVADKGIGIALKIEDGCGSKAAQMTVTHLLYKHKLITEEEYRKLDPVHPIYSQAGHKVGEMRVADY
jgi:L-asparaginase II